MDGLQIITLSDISQTKTNICYHLYAESKKMLQRTYLQSGNRNTDIENKFMVAKKKEERGQIS